MDALTGAYKFGGRFLGVMRTRFRLRPDEQARWCPYVAPHIPRGTGGEAGGEKASPASTGSPAASATPRRFLEGYRTADRHRHGGRQVLLDMRGVFAKFETNLRRERQLEGIAKAKAAGVYRGRSAPIDAPQVRAMKAQRFGGLGPRRSRRLSTSAGRPCMGIGGGAITGAGAKAPGWRPLIIPCYRRATALHCQQSNAPLRPALKKRRWDRNAQSSATSQARASHSRHHDGTAGKRVVLVRSWRARHSSAATAPAASQC